jgi:hypothetical protein
MEMPGKTVSHETIYLSVFKVEPESTRYLVCGRKRRSKRAGRVMTAQAYGYRAPRGGELP